MSILQQFRHVWDNCWIWLCFWKLTIGTSRLTWFFGWLMGGAQRRRVGCRSCMGSGVCIIYVWCAYKSPHKCRHPPSTYCSPGLFKTSPFVDTGTSTSEVFIGIIIMFKEFSIEIISCTINNIYLSMFLTLYNMSQCTTVYKFFMWESWTFCN